jgi:tetratricopeptide (TPR) repeat protein
VNTWKTHIESGNNYFRNEAYDQAESAYIQACGRAEKLFRYWLDTEEIITAIIASYCNLADSLKCQGRYQAALEVLEKAHQLISVNLREAREGSDRYQGLLKGRKDTYKELQQFISIMNSANGETINPVPRNIPVEISGLQSIA